MNHYMRVIRSALVLKAFKDVGRLKATNDKCEIRVLARDLAIVCKLLDYIDNDKPLFSFEDFYV